MRSHPPQDLTFFDAASFRVQESVVLPVSREEAFAALEDASGWTRWFPLMTRAEWLTPSPRGVGSEREVALTLFGTFRERFIAWEPAKRFAFTIVLSSSPLAEAIAEDYRLSELGPSSCRLDWTFAATPSALGRPVKPLFGLVMRQIFRRGGVALASHLLKKEGSTS